jgi:hypothetical protein
MVSRQRARRVHGQAESGGRIANRQPLLAMPAMDTNIDECMDDPFQGLVLLMRIFWGPMFWPSIIVKVLAYLWCAYQVLV